MNGTFIDSPKDGLTACFYDDGSKHVCDQNGSQCTYYPPPPKKMEETSWADPITADAPLVTEDSQTVAPVYAPLEVIAEAPVDASVDSQIASAVESAAVAAPVNAADVPVEEPVAAADSTEQP
jgi:hypothetical protein